MNNLHDSGLPDEPPVPAASSVMKSAALGECPRCGARTMFSGLVNFADTCGKCGLDYASFNVGDGPAAFLTLAIGTVLAVAAIVFDQAFHPPFWVHAIIWVPLTAIMVVYGLRVAKGALMVVEFRRDAREAGSRDVEPARHEADESES
ncbi:DUF983 domain-containing protein [Croceicoccus ponticola]|uniref:DUF983 domain-containing protein n=1 Tax=Croceicoccus ponticola TaxID=2217664 RepID=A0A437H1R8_9SPHN|nr:DUF983 domain-containing protein [Croceicoccus ponticola]RVQ69565.1 DUF983 domain-containing protein [Croceicoccus ponticola]